MKRVMLPGQQAHPNQCWRSCCPMDSNAKSGEEMTLNRGKTYFALVDNDELSNFSCQ